MLKIKPKRDYYNSRQDAMAIREPGHRIYYDADEMAYYVSDPKKKTFNLPQLTRGQIGDIVLLVGCSLTFAVFLCSFN